MISRICHGWTTIENTDIYENLLTTDIFPAIASKTFEPSPRQAAGNVLPVTAVLRSTERMKVCFQFAR